MNELSAIDWSEDVFEIDDQTMVDLSAEGGVDRTEMMRMITRLYEDRANFEHYVYCLSFQQDDCECWYVGETQNLAERISTHLRTKDVTNIEVVEGASDRTEALEREREMSYEMAIDKGTTEIYGGR